MWVVLFGVGCRAHQTPVIPEKMAHGQSHQLSVCNAFYSSVSRLYSEELGGTIGVVGEIGPDTLDVTTRIPSMGDWMPSAPIEPVHFDLEIYTACLKQQGVETLDKGDWWIGFCNEKEIRFGVTNFRMYMNENEAIVWATGYLGPALDRLSPSLYLGTVRFAYSRNEDNTWTMVASTYSQRPVQYSECGTQMPAR